MLLRDLTKSTDAIRLMKTPITKLIIFKALAAVSTKATKPTYPAKVQRYKQKLQLFTLRMLYTVCL